MDTYKLSPELSELKARFAALFPEYDRRLSAAKSEAEIEAIRRQILAQNRMDIAREARRLGREDILHAFADEDGLVVPLHPETYAELTAATGGDIEKNLLVLMDALERLQNLKDCPAATVTYAILGAGLIGVTLYAMEIMYAKLAELSLVTPEVLTPIALEGVEAVGPSLCCMIVTGIIVALLIPLVYFIMKPAACILLVINELHQDLNFVSDYNIHGKRVTITKTIPRVDISKGGSAFYSAGFFATSKKDEALIGTQYGMIFQQKDIDKVRFCLGVGCPLSKGKNNCAVDFNATAQSVAQLADSRQAQEDLLTYDRYTLSIKCNSGSGSVAYYIARVCSN